MLNPYTLQPLNNLTPVGLPHITNVTVGPPNITSHTPRPVCVRRSDISEHGHRRCVCLFPLTFATGL